MVTWRTAWKRLNCKVDSRKGLISKKVQPPIGTGTVSLLREISRAGYGRRGGSPAVLRNAVSR